MIIALALPAVVVTALVLAAAHHARRT